MGWRHNDLFLHVDLGDGKVVNWIAQFIWLVFRFWMCQENVYRFNTHHSKVDRTLWKVPGLTSLVVRLCLSRNLGLWMAGTFTSFRLRPVPPPQARPGRSVCPSPSTDPASNFAPPSLAPRLLHVSVCLHVCYFFSPLGNMINKEYVCFTCSWIPKSKPGSRHVECVCGINGWGLWTGRPGEEEARSPHTSPRQAGPGPLGGACSPRRTRWALSLGSFGTGRSRGWTSAASGCALACPAPADWSCRYVLWGPGGKTGFP